MESISELFYSTISDIVPVSLSEAETEEYPYAVYSHEPEYIYSKEGLSRVSTELDCDIYGKDYDECLEIGEAIRKAVSEQLNASGIAAYLTETRKDCAEGVWDIMLRFRIIQIA